MVAVNDTAQLPFCTACGSRLRYDGLAGRYDCMSCEDSMLAVSLLTAPGPEVARNGQAVAELPAAPPGEARLVEAPAAEKSNAQRRREGRPQRRSHRIAGMLRLAEAAAQWGVSRHWLATVCMAARFPGAVRLALGPEGLRWYVPDTEDIPLVSSSVPKVETVPEGLLLLKELAARWGVPGAWLSAQCKAGGVVGALKLHNGRTKPKWYIPETAVCPERPGTGQRRWATAPEGMMPLAEAADRWGVRRKLLTALCGRGRIAGAVILPTGKVRPRWYIPESTEPPRMRAVTVRPASKIVEAPDGMITLREAAARCGVSPGRLSVLCAQGQLEGAAMLVTTQTRAKWYIPESTVLPEPGRRKGAF